MQCPTCRVQLHGTAVFSDTLTHAALRLLHCEVGVFGVVGSEPRALCLQDHNARHSHSALPMRQCVQTLDRRRYRLTPALPADTPSAKPAWMIFMRGPQDSSIHSVTLRRMNTGFDHTRPMPQKACAPVT